MAMNEKNEKRFGVSRGKGGKMQKLVIDTSREWFARIVNQHLTEDWRIVPGSIGAVSLEREAGQYERGTPSGVVYDAVYWVVLEKEEERKGD